MEEKKKSRHGCLWALVIFQFLALVVLLSVLAVVSLAGSLMSTSVGKSEAGVDEYPRMKEMWAYGTGETKVVVISLSGMIFLGQDNRLFPSAMGSAHTALRSIRRATHDKDVKAIILNVDSGGGGITASDILLKALQDFKQAQEGRKVISLFGDIAASGAYYVALASDHIVAHPTTITGSIGVLLQRFDMRELARKIGVEDVTIKSGRNKDMLNPLKEFTPEQRAMLQEVIDQLHSRFVSLVAANRRLPLEKVRKFSDGRIFTSTNALDMGLIDAIGYWKDAVKETTRLLGVENVKVFRYEEAFSFASLMKATFGREPIFDMLSRASQTRLMYVWQL